MRRSIVPVAGVLALAMAAPAPAYPRPGRTLLASPGEFGGGNDWSSLPVISANGRYVAYHSWADDLVPGDVNGRIDVFVHDLETGTTEIASVGHDGSPSRADSITKSISDDGRFVALLSGSNLVPEDTNGRLDVYVRDREVGTTELISVTANGGPVAANSSATAISGDGRFVAFVSGGTDLVPDDSNDNADVFIRDRQTGLTELVSVASDETQGDAPSTNPHVSADGRFVVFPSQATNLVPEDTNQAFDVFLRDRVEGTTERISVSSRDAATNGASFSPEVSEDGSVVAFMSYASNLVPEDTNLAADIFVRDRTAGVTERVSVTGAGAEAAGASTEFGLSPDGRFVAFASGAANLAAGDDNGAFDAFIHDRLTGATDLVSMAEDGLAGSGHAPAVSAGGRRVAFMSDTGPAIAAGQFPGQEHPGVDVFARERGPAIGVVQLDAVTDGDSILVSGWAGFTGAEAVSATDQIGDAPADAADLTGAAVALRPEGEDLLVRLRLAALPSIAAPLLAGSVAASATAGPMAGLAFQAGGIGYQVRALRAAPTAIPPAAPHFALLRCQAQCVQVAELEGGYGTAGDVVSMSVPLQAVGYPAALTALRAFTAAGGAAIGPLHEFDTLALPDAAVPRPEVRLGIAPAGTPLGSVAFGDPVGLAEGRFETTIPAPGPGAHTLWSRACLGNQCSTRSVELA